MKLMLDTNIVSYLSKGYTPNNKIFNCESNEFFVSSIVYAEIMYGHLKNFSPSRDQFISAFFENCPVLTWGKEQAIVFSHLRTKLESKGMKMSLFDTMIAAHALSVPNCVLITDDKAFCRVPNLRIETF